MYTYIHTYIYCILYITAEACNKGEREKERDRRARHASVISVLAQHPLCA
jgi:hypothetical protein